MAAPAILLGLDVAADGVGMIALTGDGNVLSALRRSYASSEGDATAAEWWRATRTGVKELLRRAGLRPEQVRAIGLAGDPGAAAAVDKDGEILATCPFGDDPAVEPHLAAVVGKAGARNLANLAGGPVAAASVAAKLQWLRAHHKRAWHDCHLVLPPKDFIRLRLCGTVGTDGSDATATGLFNPKTRAWSKQLLQWFDVQAAWMPPVGLGNAMAGRVLEASARDAGLQAGTPVVVGASHAAALAVAAGVLDATATLVEVGDGGCVFAPTAEAIRDPAGRLRTGCHSLGGWALHADGCASAGQLAAILDRHLPAEAAQARRAGRSPVDAVCELAAAAPAGAGGLLWLPGGGFAPAVPDPSPAQLARAAVEAGALAVRAAVGAIARLRGGSGRIALAGRGCAHPVWCQAVADALGATVTATRIEEPAAAGAAVLAATAVGVHKGIAEALPRMIRSHGAVHARKAGVEALAQAARRLDAAHAAAAGDGAALGGSA